MPIDILAKYFQNPFLLAGAAFLLAAAFWFILARKWKRGPAVATEKDVYCKPAGAVADCETDVQQPVIEAKANRLQSGIGSRTEGIASEQPGTDAGKDCGETTRGTAC